MGKSRMSSKKRMLAAVLVLTGAMLCAGCGTKEDGGEQTGGGMSSVTESGVTVTMTTDKESYQEGEEIRYTITVENNRPHYKIDKFQINYTNTANYVAKEGEELPYQFPMIDENGSHTVEGTLVHQEGVGATSHPVLTSKGDYETVTLRPYLRVTYAGEEVTLRVTMELHLFQKYLNVSSSLLDKGKTITCHDPSVFRDFDGQYYIVGSFLSGGKTADLQNWVSMDSTFQGAFSKEERELIRAWNDDESAGSWNGYLWAPDLIYNTELKKYCMYISANGDNWKSNIVMATADQIDGPYQYAGTVVYGGFCAEDYAQTDAPSILGEDTIPERYVKNGVKNKKWGDAYPNCIDPCVFYDAEGKLWMSYGSWSGGIFLLALDGKTGLRDTSVTYSTDLHSDAYFGKKIAGGAYVSGEASYIQRIGEYYYLFVSYGNLEAAGGYNVRIFRSTRPDGPYVDALGNDALTDRYYFNYNSAQGIRLFGAYKWRTFVYGQVAQGHNSAFVDEDGRAYMIFHTRTTNGTEYHYVKAHQLFVNRDGWLVAAPYQTSGEALSETGITKQDVVGEYDVILHELEIDYKNLQTQKPKCMFLKEDGTIEGRYTGTWSVEEGTSYLTLTIGEVRYQGVGLFMNVEGTKVQTFVFTALGDSNQLTIWGSKVFE